MRRSRPLTSEEDTRIPDPGEHVDLRTENGAWRQGFRALSKPWTADTGEVMIWVATEDEYRAAEEGRSERCRRTVVHGASSPDFPSPRGACSQVSVRWAVGRTQIHVGRR